MLIYNQSESKLLYRLKETIEKSKKNTLRSIVSNCPTIIFHK